MPVIQFKGKTAVESYHRVAPHHTLEIDEKLSETKTPSFDGNLIVEGDNLIALKSLLPTHAGRIKCIYLDPPYNTGEEGWVYNDNLTQPQFKEWIGQVVGKEGEDATRHDKWCCMMYPRLQLLKELLTDDGAIFVSIDDNEVHHLRMLMDEVFGEENMVENFCWKKSYGGGAKEKFAIRQHEYVVMYAKSKDALGALWLPPDEEAEAKYYKYKDSKFELRGPYRIKPLEATKSMDPRENLVFPIVTPKGGTIQPKRQWWWSRERVEAARQNDELVFTETVSGTTVSYKQYLQDEFGEKRGAKPFSVIDKIYTQEGTGDLRRLFNDEVVLQFPKPVALLKRLIQIGGDTNGIILDPTAGSGTTGQAVLDLNKEDGGNRRFVLVQQPYDTKDNEKAKFNICEKITAERVRRVSRGYNYKTQNGKTEKVAGLGGEFTYARVGPVLMSEYRDLGENLPAYEQLARYIFFTETSRHLDPKQLNEKTGFIGEWKGTSYYLLYTPNEKEDRAMDVAFLENLKDKNTRKVIYCEKVWVHYEDLPKFGDIRPMLVPFNLK